MFKNSFGSVFRITTFGESHGFGIGVVIDGCPAGLNIEEEEICEYLSLRAPGKKFTSSRKEPDRVKILSGVFEGKTTAAPICLLISNEDVVSHDYEKVKNVLRPEHANATYMMKYGYFDYRGGGRASGRETAARVAASFIAKKLLAIYGIKSIAYLKALGNITLKNVSLSVDILLKKRNKSEIFTVDENIEKLMIRRLKNLQKTKDTIGSIVGFLAEIPKNLGEPVFEKLPAKIGSLMLSIPGAKGFEIDDGFMAAKKKGSSRNSGWRYENHRLITQSSTLGGISTGQPLMGTVAFKPPSTIGKKQKSVDFARKEKEFAVSDVSRHDVTIGIRGAIVVEACLNLALLDLFLLNRLARI